MLGNREKYQLVGYNISMHCHNTPLGEDFGKDQKEIQDTATENLFVLETDRRLCLYILLQ